MIETIKFRDESLMDISLLQTFLEVAKTRHFGRSADNLFITQSAVSARIKLLEDILGVSLFVRKRNDIQLTPAGSRLHKHALSIVHGWERVRQEIALEPDLSGALALGCVFDLWSIFVGQKINELQKSWSDTAIQIEILAADVLVQRLTAGTLDIALMFDPPQTPDLELKQIAALPLVLVSTSDGQLPEEVMRDNYVMVDWGSAFGVVHAETFQDIPAPLLRTNSAVVALDLICERGGAAYLPEQLISHQLENRRLFRVDQAPVIERLSFAVYRPESLTNRKLLETIEYLCGN